MEQWCNLCIICTHYFEVVIEKVRPVYQSTHCYVLLCGGSGWQTPICIFKSTLSKTVSFIYYSFVRTLVVLMHVLLFLDFSHYSTASPLPFVLLRTGMLWTSIPVP